MDLRLVHENPDKRLNYYSYKGKKIVGDNFKLLGFGDNLAVVSPLSAEPPIMKGPIKIIRKFPGSVSMPKLEVDESGEKFINLNGKKLKLVPQSQIPEEVRKRTMMMKQQMVNIGGSGSMLQPRGINSVAQTNGADTLQLVKPRSVDKLTTDKDKSTTQGMKKIKLISTKIQKPVILNKVIHTQNSVQSTLPVNPLVTVVQLDSQGKICDDNSSFSADHLLPVRRNCEKLLTKQNIKLLNFVKMQALNLSKKKLNNNTPHATKHIVEAGVQTDADEPKTFSDKTVQTDIQENSKQFNFLDCLDLNNMFDSVGESPLISDVNFGIGPTMGNFTKLETVDRTMNIGVSAQNNISHAMASKQINDITMMKKLLFFKDLRECLTYNISGNLPIHDGVLYNDIGLVKRHCIALRARKAGVNLENHDGCTPIQLAVINDAHIEIVQTLLDFGADIREPDGEGNNILHLCAKFGRQQILKDILSHPSFSEDVECINNFNYEGLTPLMICCISSWTAGASLLISSGAQVNLRDQTSGRTALFHAAEAQNADIVGTLLHHKADPKIKNFFGTSPHDAMYELEDMPEAIKSLIFGKSKKRSIEAEMSPARTAKAAKTLKTFSKLQKTENNDGVPIIVPPVRYKIQNEVK